jgi:hypothetical protein
MEITTEQKTLLQAVEPQLETSFLEGVTASGAFLPALPGYATIPEALRPPGRQGILATFAALLKGLADFRPTFTDLTLVNEFSQWGDPEYFAAGSALTPTGEVILRGLVRTPTTAASGATFGVLPVGHRPAKNIIVLAIVSEVPTPVTITPYGTLALRDAVSAESWISLDSIKFQPA